MIAKTLTSRLTRTLWQGFKTVLHGAWRREDSTAVGCSNHGAYQLNPQFTFTLTQPSRLCARLQVTNSNSFPINLSLFSLSPASLGGSGGSSGGGGNSLPLNASPKKAVCTSTGGVYSDRPTGVALATTASQGDLAPGVWCLVPSSFDPTEGTFDIIVSFSCKTPVSFSRTH